MKTFAAEIVFGSRVTGEIYGYLVYIELKILTARNISDRNWIRETYLTFAPLRSFVRPRIFVHTAKFKRRQT